MKRGYMIREIAAEEQCVYEIFLCPPMTLTNLDDLRKIGDIQKTKRKAAEPLSALTGTRTANRLSLNTKDSVAASDGLSQADSVFGPPEVFLWLPQCFSMATSPPESHPFRTNR
jgi:hypothetical protein